MNIFNNQALAESFANSTATSDFLTCLPFFPPRNTFLLKKENFFCLEYSIKDEEKRYLDSVSQQFFSDNHQLYLENMQSSDTNAPSYSSSLQEEKLSPPSRAFQELFLAMAVSHLFQDSKTIADLIPKVAPKQIMHEYFIHRNMPAFSLRDFVNQYFIQSPLKTVPFVPNPQMGVKNYITVLWDVLSRPAEIPTPYSSLLALPYPYVVPGGRFTEIYYWDSYFTMIGLYEANRKTMLHNMIEDMSSFIDRYGYIPNGNRTYYLSRSQPPFYSLMLSLLADEEGQQAYTNRLSQLQREYDYWMDGEDKLTSKSAYRRVVRLANGAIMNRHWDDLDTPRDESYTEDLRTAVVDPRPSQIVYRNLRAGAETGWDYSSRWLADGKTLHTIQTVDLLPIELNCLLEHLEETLAYAYDSIGNKELSEFYRKKAKTRLQNIRQIFWNKQKKGFFDYNWKTEKRTNIVSAAMVVPLYLKIATKSQAAGVAHIIETQLLQIGGLVTTDQKSGQQWDYPNGWASLQWMAVQGLNQYGYKDLAHKIAVSWMQRVISIYDKSGVLLEKYDVVSPTIDISGGEGGGEYTNQIGFGWTNSILLAFMNLYPDDANYILDRSLHEARIKQTFP